MPLAGVLSAALNRIGWRSLLGVARSNKGWRKLRSAWRRLKISNDGSSAA